MNILLVEDEEHKSEDIKKRISNGLPDASIQCCGGVKEAVIAASRNQFDLVVLDMALPTFDGRSAKVSGGEGQVVGGLEVLRALHATGRTTRIIIVTQYHDVIIGGEKVRLAQLPKLIALRYGQQVLGAILYSFNSPKWEAAFDSLLARAK